MGAEVIPSRLGQVALNAFAVTPSDTVDFTHVARSLYVGGAGNVVVIPYGQTDAVTFVGVPAGTILPIAATRVNSTSTTATSIVGLY